MMSQSISSIRKDDIDEVFPSPPIREVAFEIRFPTRLRINAELWKLQDQLVEEYPSVTTEPLFLGGPAPIDTSVFQNPTLGRVLKVSQQNFIIAFTKYVRFEDFKEEVVTKVKIFCETFQVPNLQRVGLRYINDIFLPAGNPSSMLLEYVRPYANLERVGTEAIERFITEFQVSFKNHMVILRGALLPALDDGRRVYVLDVDCHSKGVENAVDIELLLETYHDSAQRFFLDHVTESYKKLMRGK